MTPVPVTTARIACALPYRPMFMIVQLKVSHCMDGGQTCAVSLNKSRIHWFFVICYSDIQMISISFFFPTEKYTTTCPSSFVYDYTMTSCGRTCRSLSQSDLACEHKSDQFDGCGCPNGHYLNDNEQCVLASQCPCHAGGAVVRNGALIKFQGQTWWALKSVWIIYTSLFRIVYLRASY